MSIYDWFVIFGYILIVVGISFFVGKKQKNQEDYYIAGKSMKFWQVGSSLVANQVSAISLVGVPAFIAVKKAGGLKWLQYEFAVPLSMIFIIIFLIPVYRHSARISIYEYLEKRFGKTIRSILSFVFLLSRSLASGVALLATSYVTAVALNLEIKTTIIIIALISLIYTAIGGIKADIYSDIIQLIILWISSIVSIFILYKLIGGDFSSFASLSPERLKIFHIKETGFGDGENFGFLPMLVGGFFLYISYYGCDQSQAQRILTTKDDKEAQKALAFNSLLRFPLVLTYSAVGVLFLIFISNNSNFSSKLSSLPPDYAMPIFFKTFFPAGLLGVVVAGIFAASMSSLDSAINSLSAATWEDFLIKAFPALSQIKDKKKIMASRLITVFWGIFTTYFAILIANSSETVVEIVNKIGSAFYGPIAAVFFIGIFTKAKERTVIAAFFLALFFNIYLWLFMPQVSWLWWNFIGFAIPFIFVFSFSLIKKEKLFDKNIGKKIEFRPNIVLMLSIWFLIIILLSLLIEKLL